MIRIQSPTDEYIQHSFQESDRGSVNENQQSGYYITTPSKTDKKPNKSNKSNTSKSNIQNQSILSVSNTSILKQVIRKDQELEEFRQCNIKLQDKVNGLEFLLNKAAEEVRRKNEDQNSLELQLIQLKNDLQLQERFVMELENQQQSYMLNDPQLKKMWERGAYLESENEQLRQQILAMEQELMQKLDTLQQTQMFVEKVQVDYLKQEEDTKTKIKQIKKLKSKNKNLKVKQSESDQSEKLISALRMEIENQREDMKELLKEKIDQERLIKKLGTGTKQFDNVEVSTLQQQMAIIQNQCQVEQNLNKQLSQKISFLMTQTQEPTFQNDDQIAILEQELENHRILLKKNEISHDDQLKSLRQEIHRLRDKESANMAQSQSLRYDFSRSASSQGKQVPGLNLRGSVALEEAEMFLSEERGKVCSSRIGTQRPVLKKQHMHVNVNNIHNEKSHNTVRSHIETSTHSENEPQSWVLTLSGTQLQEELYKSIDRESDLEAQLNKLFTRLLTQTNQKVEQSQTYLSDLQTNFGELQNFVGQLHEQLWVEQQRNQIYRDIIQDLKSYSMTLKAQLSEHNSMFKSLSTVDMIIPEDIMLQNINLEEFKFIFVQLTQKFKDQQMNHQQEIKKLSISKEGDFDIQRQSITKLTGELEQTHKYITEIKTQFESQVSQFKQLVQELQDQVLSEKAKIIEIQQDAEVQQIEFQREKQEIYQSWELDQALLNEKLNQAENDKKKKIFENSIKLEDLQRQLNKTEESKRLAVERIQTLTDNYDSEQSQIQMHTPQSTKNSLRSNDLETAIKHYKSKAKEQLQRRVSELETVLCYLNDIILGFRYETNSYRINSIQNPEDNQSTDYCREKMIHSIEKLELKNPTLINYIHQMKINIDDLYDQGLQFKVKFLNFLNTSVVQIITQNSVDCESLIRDNHDVQMSLNWLLEAGKNEGESEHLRNDKYIFDNVDTLWSELITKLLSSNQQSVQYENSGIQSQSHLSSFLQSEAPSQSPIVQNAQQTLFGMTNSCSVPELSEIMDIQMTVVCNLLSALTTICQKNNSNISPSTSQQGNEWLASIRPSLDQTTQIVKVLAPFYFKVDDHQQQLDSFVNRAFSGLSTLNKKLNDLPPNFFNSLTLQHNSLIHCVLQFANSISQIKEPEDEREVINNFNDQLKDMTDTMQMFSLYILEVCTYFTTPDVVKDLTTTFIVHLHRKEIKSTQSEFLKRTKQSESRSAGWSSYYSQTVKQNQNNQSQDQFFLLEELATFFSQLSIHLSL